MGVPLRLTVGVGYLGITHAACMASLGFEVLGVDTDAGKVAKLAAGVTPIYEPGLAELLQAEIGTARALRDYLASTGKPAELGWKRTRTSAPCQVHQQAQPNSSTAERGLSQVLA